MGAEFTKPHVIPYQDPETGQINHDAPPLAYVHPASPWAVQATLTAPEGHPDGRSEYVWLRLNNGDLILGVFPRGETYFAVEVDAHFPGEGRTKPEPLCPMCQTETTWNQYEDHGLCPWCVDDREALIRRGKGGDFEDGEILGLDEDGYILQWNADDSEMYNCGESPEEFGLYNIRDREMKRIKDSQRLTRQGRK